METPKNQANVGFEIEPVICITCGIWYAMPKEVYEQRKISRRDYFCPNGHAQFFKNILDNEKKLRDEIKEKDGRIYHMGESMKILHQEIELLKRKKK